MKYAIVSTITPGYMFGLNATRNALEWMGCRPEIHAVQHQMPQDYQEKTSLLYTWIPMERYSHCYHRAKYLHARTLTDYDAICLIDGDLFICADLTPYFERVARYDLLISATWPHTGGKKSAIQFDNPQVIRDRADCQLADFPVFLHPQRMNAVLTEWLDGMNLPGEAGHPLIAFNRAVAKCLRADQVEVLDGEEWINDNDYWKVGYQEIDHRLVKSDGHPAHAVHNKWWKNGRANGELRNQLQNGATQDAGWIERMQRGMHHMNLVRDVMAWHNARHPVSAWPDYCREQFTVPLPQEVLIG